jgi:hypothetical protein
MQINVLARSVRKINPSALIIVSIINNIIIDFTLTEFNFRQYLQTMCLKNGSPL